MASMCRPPPVDQATNTASAAVRAPTRASRRAALLNHFPAAPPALDHRLAPTGSSPSDAALEPPQSLRSFAGIEIGHVGSKAPNVTIRIDHRAHPVPVEHVLRCPVGFGTGSEDALVDGVHILAIQIETDGRSLAATGRGLCRHARLLGTEHDRDVVPEHLRVPGPAIGAREGKLLFEA